MSKNTAQLTKGALRIRATYQGEESDKSFYRSSVIIGRATGTSRPDLDLPNDNTISRSHARIWMEEGSCWIEDLGSKYGTKVDGKDIRGNGKVRVDGTSAIHVGDTALKIENHVDNASGFAELPPQAALASTIEIEKTIDTAPGSLFLPRTPTLELMQQQTLLLEILVQFSLPAPLDQLLQTIITRVIDLIPGAKRGALLLSNAQTDALLLAAFVSPAEPAVSETLAKRALNRQQAFVWRNSFGSDHAVSIRRHQIQSGMYAPLIYDGQPLGVLCVDNPDCQTAFSNDDLQLLVVVADHAAVAVSHHQSREELSRKSLLLDTLLGGFSPVVRSRLLEKARLVQKHLQAEKSDELQVEIRKLLFEAQHSEP